MYDDIRTHAKSCYPDECCGLIIENKYYPCINIASNPQCHFEIDPMQFIELSELGDIQAIVHSHPNGNAQLSSIDKQQMALHGIDWLIYGMIDDDFNWHSCRN